MPIVPFDGLHRVAEVFEARGDNRKAAEYYRQTAEFAEQAEGFGKESVDFFQNKTEQLAEKKNEFLFLLRFPGNNRWETQIVLDGILLFIGPDNTNLLRP